MEYFLRFLIQFILNLTHSYPPTAPSKNFTNNRFEQFDHRSPSPRQLGAMIYYLHGKQKYPAGLSQADRLIACTPDLTFSGVALAFVTLVC
jgi:hypothetical protein